MPVTFLLDIILDLSYLFPFSNLIINWLHRVRTVSSLEIGCPTNDL